MVTVLIADHNSERVGTLATEVARLGYDTRTALSFDAVLDAVRNERIDVLLAPLALDDRDGIDLVRQVRVVSPDTRPILIGPNASARQFKAAMEAGAVEVLTQDLSADELSEAFKKALEDQGFQGVMHGLALTDVLQMLHYSRRSATLRIGESGARVHMTDGAIVHAEMGELRGKDALRAILTRRTGSLFTLPPQRVVPTILDSFEALLLDIMRDIDEASRPQPRASSTPPTPPPPDPPEFITPSSDLSEIHPDRVARDEEIHSSDLVDEAATEVETAHSPMAPAEPKLVADLLDSPELRPPAPVAMPEPLAAPEPPTGPMAVPISLAVNIPPSAAVPSVPQPNPNRPSQSRARPPSKPPVRYRATGANLSSDSEDLEEVDDDEFQDDVDDDDDDRLEPQGRSPLIGILIIAALAAAAIGAYLYLNPNEDPDHRAPTRLTGERVEQTVDPPPSRARLDPPPSSVPSPPVSPGTPATSSAASAPLRRVTIKTRPSGWSLVDAGSGLPLGTSPLEVTLPASGELTVRAKSGSQESSDLLVKPRASEGEVELDLSAWVHEPGPTSSPPPPLPLKPRSKTR